MLRSWQAFKSRYQLTNSLIVTILATVIISSYTIYIYIFNKCDMQSILLPLLSTAARHFSTVNATYFLDYGSLLGAYRDGGVVPWEFDVDMAVMEEDCEKFLTLKDAFAADGFTMYKRGDYVEHKKSVIMGYDAYLHKACARIYDKDFKYYIDFDWYQRYTYEEAMKKKAEEEASGGRMILPDNYQKSDGDIICNIEAFDGSWPGGCRVVSWVYPLRSWNVLGVEQWIPNNPEKNLEACYGPTWTIPRPKGYKYLLCGWFPTHIFPFLLLWIAFSSIPFVLYTLVPLLWDKFLIAIGKRNVTHKYTTLPLYQK